MVSRGRAARELNGISAMWLFLSAALVSWLAGFPVRRLLVRWTIVDQPNARSSHSEPVARGGGLGILFALGVVATAVVPGGPLLAAWLGAGLGVAVISFLDDLRPQPAWLRFGCQLAGAVLFAAVAGWPTVLLSFQAAGGVQLPAMAGTALVLFCLVGHTNAFNFMDGINGLAAGQAALTGVGMAVVTGLSAEAWDSPPVLLCWAVAGAAAGFLPHNFPRARMFMGDVSSAPLGLMLAALAVWLASVHGPWLLLPLALLHANFLLDTAITLARRVARGERWFEAHREHFYQRLIRAGKSHAFVTGAELALQLAVLGLMICYVLAAPEARPWLAAAVVALWLGFFGWAEILFRRTQPR